MFISSMPKGVVLVDIESEGDVDLIEENIRAEDLNPRDVSVLSITHPHMNQDDGAAKAKKLFECRLATHEITAEIIESRFQKSQNKPPAAQRRIINVRKPRCWNLF